MSIHCHSMLGKLLLISLLVSDSVAIIFPSSPCPAAFVYEDDSADNDRWYGELTIVSRETYNGITLRVTLDRPSHLIATWIGPVITTDNQVFIIENTDERIDRGVEYKYRIMTKFDPSYIVPFVQTIHLNGHRICPADAPLTLTFGENEGSDTKPDLELPEAPSSVVITDVTRRPNTTQPPRKIISEPRNACGVVDMATPLITYGARTQRGQWPWHVALYKTDGGNLNYKCGATLVSKNKVITAAHCVSQTGVPGKTINPNQIVLYLGKHKLHVFLGEEGVQAKQVTKIAVHPNYTSDNYYGDVAVLTLADDIDYTTYVRPVCLWEVTNGTADIEGKEGSVVGWGLDENENTADDLKVAKLPVVSTETCLRSYPQFYSQFTSNGTFCAGFRNGTSPCNGDSGGGIVFNRNNTWYLRGVVSLSVAKEGLNFCDPKYYVIFTDLTRFRDFIQKNL